MKVHHLGTDILTLCNIKLLEPMPCDPEQLFFTDHGFGTKDTLPVKLQTYLGHETLVTRHSEVVTCFYCKRALGDMARIDTI